MRDPSWRMALAGAARDPVQALAVGAATALLVVGASTSVLVEWTSGQAALERLAETSVVQQGSNVGLDVVVAVPSGLPGPLAGAIDARIDELDGFEPAEFETRSIGWLVRSGPAAVRPVVRADGRSAPAVLHHREGAIESLEVVAGPDATGTVWLPAELADALGLRPGDEFDVGFEPLGAEATATSARTTLAGTYATEDGRPVGRLADDAVRLPPAPGDPTRSAALVLGDAATIQRLGDDLGDIQLSSLQAAATRPPRYEDLRRGVEQLDVLQRDLFDPDAALGAMVFEEYNGPEVRVATGARQLTTLAERTADAVGDQVTGAATAGTIVAAATLVAAVLAAARRRRDRTRLELVQGSAPIALAARGALAMAPAVVLGALLGRLVVLPLAGVVLPAARVPGPAVDALTPTAVDVALVALSLVLLVLAADAWLRQSTLGGTTRTRSVPAVPVLLAATAVVIGSVALGPARPPTDPVVMLMPVLVVAAVAVLVLRLLVGLVPGSGAPTRGPTAWWLARRRLAGQAGRLVAVGAAVATAAGLVAHTSVLFASGVAGVEAKAAAVAGASVVVAVPGPSLPTIRGLTVVLEDDVDVLPEETRARLLAVDAATFASVAAWPRGTTPDVLDTLSAASGASLPVLVVDGATPLGDRGTLERSGRWALPYEVVGRPTALPGVDPGRPLVLTTQDALFVRLGDDQDPRLGPLDPDSSDQDGPWQTEVWSDGTADVALAAAAILPVSGVRVVRTLDGVRAQPAYLAATWSLGVLGGLGVVVLVLALLLLGTARSQDADEAGLELAMLQRLGVPRARQGRATVVERLLLVAVAGGTGALTGTALTAVVIGAADPAPEVAPALTPVLPAEALVGLAGALLLGGLVAGLLDHRAARRADVEEALRVAR